MARTVIVKGNSENFFEPRSVQVEPQQTSCRDIDIAVDACASARMFYVFFVTRFLRDSIVKVVGAPQDYLLWQMYDTVRYGLVSVF